MKKLKYFICLGLFVFLCTGCVKFNANMEIKKDKSMDYSIIYAVDTSLMGDDKLITDSEKKDLEKKGFKVEDYSEDSMKGFKLSINVKNIDKISTTKDTNYDLSGILKDKKDDTKYVFKVKKGLFKNHYIADFKFDSSDSSLSSNKDVSYREEDEEDDSDTNVSDDTSDDLFGDFDYGSMGNMDLSFNVKLPYSATKNNATSTKDDNKELKWNLSSTGTDSIQFEFELYNVINIVIICALGGLLVIGAIVVVIVVVTGKGKKTNVAAPTPNDTISPVSA